MRRPSKRSKVPAAPVYKPDSEALRGLLKSGEPADLLEKAARERIGDALASAVTRPPKLGSGIAAMEIPQPQQQPQKKIKRRR